MAYSDLVNELVGSVPGISVFLARSYIKRAWQDIRDLRHWGFLLAEGAIVCPTEITTGTVAFAQYGVTVTCNAAATLALTGLVQPVITSRQIRLNVGGLGGNAVYNITAADFTGPLALLTVDRLIQEPTTAACPYQVYRCYVTPPAADFARFVYVTDITNGNPLDLDRRRDWLDRQDPQRMSMGQACVLAWYGAEATTGRPIYEFWPHPTDGQVFMTSYRRRGTDFVAAADVQPETIPDQLIMARALGRYAYQWAQVNAGRFPTFKGKDFLALKKAALEDYIDLLRVAIREDEARFPQKILSRGHSLRRGLASSVVADANFWQGHPTTW